MPDAAALPKQKYLVPVDFSRKSEMALEFALTFGVGGLPDIYLFHVFEDATKNFRRLDRLNQEYMDRMRTTVVNTFQRLQQRGVRPQVQDVHRRIAHGKAAVEILKMAEGIQPDMIIMGAPTSNAFKKLIAKTPCTMVLIKEKG